MQCRKSSLEKVFQVQEAEEEAKGSVITGPRRKGADSRQFGCWGLPAVDPPCCSACRLLKTRSLYSRQGEVPGDKSESS